MPQASSARREATTPLESDSARRRRPSVACDAPCGGFNYGVHREMQKPRRRRQSGLLRRRREDSRSLAIGHGWLNLCPSIAQQESRGPSSLGGPLWDMVGREASSARWKPRVPRPANHDPLGTADSAEAMPNTTSAIAITIAIAFKVILLLPSLIYEYSPLYLTIFSAPQAAD